MPLSQDNNFIFPETTRSFCHFDSVDKTLSELD